MKKFHQSNNSNDDGKQPLAADLMPKTADSQQILRERAQLFAKSEKGEVEKEGVSYICFRLGHSTEHYGIPYQFTKEVMNNVIVTKLPCVPSYIAGVINRRGALIAVVDLKHFFHTQISEYTKDANIIIITAHEMTIGILADNIVGRDIYDPTTLDPPFSFRDIIKPELIVGLHRGVTAIINVDALMSTPELLVKK